jgi:gluconolactonase
MTLLIGGGDRALARRLLSRRRFTRTAAGALGAAAAASAAPGGALAQTVPGGRGPVDPPSTTTSPPREFGPGAPPNVYFNDPDVLTVDPAFGGLMQGNTSIQRLWNGPVQDKGILWAEGPAWNAQGRYLLWSDIPNNRQLRWLEDDGRVSVFRQPSNNSNGNSFDFQGRQLSCEHLTRRVVRYELDGSVTVLADSWQGKRLNSPNDVVPHPDGSVWFTDPPYGDQLYEGQPDAAGGPSNPDGRLNPRLGQPPEQGTSIRGLPTQVYRWDPSGRVDVVVTEDIVPFPNGLCFSPDYRRLYVISSGRGDITVLDVTNDNRGVNGPRGFTDCVIDGIKCGPDGIRADVNGNLWVSSNAGRNVGYSGATVWAPDGRLLGRIRIPEVVGNLTFGGPKRNRLFMAGSQSLYAVYVGTQGAAPG